MARRRAPSAKGFTARAVGRRVVDPSYGGFTMGLSGRLLYLFRPQVTNLERHRPAVTERVSELAEETRHNAFRAARKIRI